jgi:hypothetical protein
MHSEWSARNAYDIGEMRNLLTSERCKSFYFSELRPSSPFDGMQVKNIDIMWAVDKHNLQPLVVELSLYGTACLTWTDIYCFY